MYYAINIQSPLGPLHLESDGEALTALGMEARPETGESCPVFQKAQAWLEDYFRGTPRQLDVPLAPKGTAFQHMVWEILLDIPFGETRTYGSIAREMARKLGRKTMSAQAVGGAVGKNPIAIVIPCHRCMGANGSLTGFAWGLPKKQWLLEHEGIL